MARKKSKKKAKARPALLRRVREIPFKLLKKITGRARDTQGGVPGTRKGVHGEAGELVDIIDDSGKAIGKTTRKRAHEKGILHSVVNVVVENGKGEILVIKRSENSEVQPSMLGNVGGHVDAGEGRQAAAERELMEEAGVKGKPYYFGSVKVSDRQYSHLVEYFKARHDGPFRFDNKEVGSALFKTIQQVRKEIMQGKKYTPNFVAVFRKLYGKDSSGEEVVDLIDEKDNVIGTGMRFEVKRKRMLYRCAGVYVKIGGKVVIEKRAVRKQIRPGSWSIVEETLHSGETYEQAAIRGVNEELGLEAKNMKFVGKKIIRDARYPDEFMLGVFSCEAGGRMRLQGWEVEKARVLAIPGIEALLATEEQVSPGLSQTFGMYKAAETGVTVSAPEKLMLSGEWSILEMDCPCIVLAVDRKVYAKAKEAPENSVELKDFGISTKYTNSWTNIKFAKNDDKLLFTKHALETAFSYLHEKGIPLKKLRLETSSDTGAVGYRGKKMKAGLGSSAAAVVAIIGAVLKLHGLGIENHVEKERLFKLGIIAHYRAQDRIGSGFDVAASVFGGALAYKRFDAQWLQKELGRRSIASVVGGKWPHFSARHVNLPADCELLVGFTGKSASTTELVRKVMEFRERKPQQYHAIIGAIKNTTNKMVVALEMDSHSQILKLIGENGALLKGLSEASGAGLEIPQHSVMIEGAQKHGAAAKFSGAGGGDCGIGLCFDKATARKVLAEWKRHGIVPIDLKVSPEGAIVERDFR